ncbi:MAG: NUDIX hydrolase [Candidatus Niyogibacteria bacterium]|nr:NUDIX hydrolase [Candidatus Niyogibacteria bacterium]
MTKNIKTKYATPSVTVDAVIFTVVGGELKVLLIKRARSPFAGAAALPGGFLHSGETTRDAALRILREKAGVQGVYVEQLYTFDEAGRDPRGQVFSVAHFALVPSAKLALTSGGELQEPALVATRRLPKLAFDHKKIVEYAVRRLQAKLEYTNLAFSLLPAEFSFADLQELYEIVLGRKLDKRNFRKKILSLGIIKPVSGKTSGGRQRPAQLFRFTKNKPSELKKFM